MKDLFHDCNVPCTRIKTGISDSNRRGELREKTLDEAGCDDHEKEKEYSRFFNHFLQHDEHGAEKAKEVKI